MAYLQMDDTLEGNVRLIPKNSIEDFEKRYRNLHSTPNSHLSANQATGLGQSQYLEA